MPKLFASTRLPQTQSRCPVLPGSEARHRNSASSQIEHRTIGKWSVKPAQSGVAESAEIKQTTTAQGFADSATQDGPARVFG